MSSRNPRRSRLAWASVLALAAALSACGGGGGDGDDSGPPGTIDLGLANRDTASHAAMAAALGLGGADQLLTAGGVSALAQREVAQAVRAMRARPLGVVGPMDEACMMSGKTRTSFEDANGNSTPDLNERVTVEFVQCKDSADEEINGSIGVTLTQVSASGMSGSADLIGVTMLRDSATSPHSVRLDGPMQLRMTSTSPSVASFRLVASAPVTMTVSTPVFFDIVTLHTGFVQEAEFDTSALPPVGMTLGRSSMRSNGRIGSEAAGGEVTVTTVQPLVQYMVDAFPSSGAIGVAGRTGRLTLSPLSTEQVQVDLDSNDDGSIESSVAQRWDWLI